MKKFRFSGFSRAYVFLVSVTIIGLCTLFIFAFRKKQLREKYDTQKRTGILKDAYVISTSFNEDPKTQIKTDRQIFAVKGYPQLTIGDSIEIRMNGDVIVQMKDACGKWFYVVNHDY